LPARTLSRYEELARSQIIGSAVMGIGMTLLE
jgi:CO/xanthine dehydrogenase Mo-binding subunit